MTSSPQDRPDEHGQAEHDVAPLGGAVSPTPGDDGADGMAGPVYPPPETEPDARPAD
ncbi:MULTISPECIES: hypothetical protein [unclassified Modestobacter]|uniref:hypothetical protein n=1 Tax=unclassified Modestobacter TaxID=2643866 RepID=UPI0022AA2BC7|nr:MULTISPECIES: hypothetical protein [unclassified Modestobacter]MCZ2823351.1 hypothetical protein [Modestobacter sp. VKM Ac-2981]MCZ2851596.1 hypothetical protein [Modestobacter sp. VKM Ac-2982]